MEVDSVLDKKSVEQFQKLYKEKYGVDLSFEQALKMGLELINLFRVVYRPILK